jgi:hypothetical protein
MLEMLMMRWTPIDDWTVMAPRTLLNSSMSQATTTLPSRFLLETVSCRMVLPGVTICMYRSFIVSSGSPSTRSFRRSLRISGTSDGKNCSSGTSSSIYTTPTRLATGAFVVGAEVGAKVGEDGAPLGFSVGSGVGSSVGAGVGSSVGGTDGCPVGFLVGGRVIGATGSLVGVSVPNVGKSVGKRVASIVGSAVGTSVGPAVGSYVGREVGNGLGRTVGCRVDRSTNSVG